MNRLLVVQGLSVKSTRGDAVLFYALHPNGTTDLASEHGSCPTLKVSLHEKSPCLVGGGRSLAHF